MNRFDRLARMSKEQLDTVESLTTLALTLLSLGQSEDDIEDALRQAAELRRNQLDTRIGVRHDGGRVLTQPQQIIRTYMQRLRQLDHYIGAWIALVIFITPYLIFA